MLVTIYTWTLKKKQSVINIVERRLKNCIIQILAGEKNANSTCKQAKPEEKGESFVKRGTYCKSTRELGKKVANSNENNRVYETLKHVNIPESVKVNETCTTPKQRCNNVQGECYNVSTMNRFDTLHVDDNLHMDIEEKAGSDKYCRKRRLKNCMIQILAGEIIQIVLVNKRNQKKKVSRL